MHPNAHSGGPRAPAACPSCDSPFDAELSICPHCGALVPVETAVNEAVLRARRLFDRVWAGLPKSGLTRVNVLWLLALFPMVVVPAVFAAAGAGLLLGRPPAVHALGHGRRHPFGGNQQRRQIGRKFLRLLVGF